MQFLHLTTDFHPYARSTWTQAPRAARTIIYTHFVPKPSQCYIALSYWCHPLKVLFLIWRDVMCDAHLAIRTTSRLSKAMESYRQRTCPTFDTCHQDDYGRVTTLVFSMTIAYAASIQLLHILSDRDTNSYQQRLDVARECAGLAIEVSQNNPRLLHVAIGLPWTSAYEVLAWEYIWFNGPTDNEGATDVRGELDAFIDTFKIYARQYPVKYTRRDWPFRTVDKFNIHKLDLAIA